MRSADRRIGLKRLWPVMIIIALTIPGLLHAGQEITQTLDLKAGWNAVHLEIGPAEADPDIIFEGTPVTQALTYYPKNSPVQFIQDPAETPWEKSGWSRWVPSDRPEALLKNLFALQANQPYLLYCDADHTLRITGTPAFRKQRWQPDSFNFVGFHTDKTAPPTFAQFFENSRAHAGLHVYYLHNSQWLRVADPSAVNITAGQAYWVWCKGGSDHQGPMEIGLPGTGDGLNFLAAVDELEIEVTNRSPNPLTFTLESASGNEVPLSLVRSVITEDTVVTYEPFTSYSPEMSLEPGEKHKVRLAVRRKEVTADEVTGLLKITDDLGDRYYIKVRAEKI